MQFFGRIKKKNYFLKKYVEKYKNFYYIFDFLKLFFYMLKKKKKALTLRIIISKRKYNKND